MKTRVTKTNVATDIIELVNNLLSGNAEESHNALNILIARIINDPHFLDIAEYSSYRIKEANIPRLDYYKGIATFCLDRIKSNPKELSINDFTRFIGILSNLRYRDSTTIDECTRYIRKNISNFSFHQIPYIMRFIADFNIHFNLPDSFLKEGRKCFIRPKLNIAYALQRILKTQTLSEKDYGRLKAYRDEYCLKVFEDYEGKMNLKLSYYELSQLSNIYNEILKDPHNKTNEKIRNIVTNHTIANLNNARKHSILKSTTDSQLHDRIFNELKVHYNGAEKEKWLDRAGLSVDIFIPGRSVNCSKDIVIQVDGSAHFYSGDGQITAKTMHNTRDLRDAGYIVIRGNASDKILNELRNEIMGHQVILFADKEVKQPQALGGSGQLVDNKITQNVHNERPKKRKLKFQGRNKTDLDDLRGVELSRQNSISSEAFLTPQSWPMSSGDDGFISAPEDLYSISSGSGRVYGRSPVNISHISDSEDSIISEIGESLHKHHVVEFKPTYKDIVARVQKNVGAKINKK